MTTVNIQLNKVLAQRIRVWGQTIIQQQGHWGNGEATLGEEETIIQKLRLNRSITVSLNELKVLYVWWLSNCSHSMQDGNDVIITQRLIKAFIDLRDILKKEYSETKDSVVKSRIIDIDKKILKLKDPQYYEEQGTPIQLSE